MNHFKGICKILLTSAIALALMHSARARAEVSSSSNSTAIPGQIISTIDDMNVSLLEKKFGLTAILTTESNLEEESSKNDESSATLELLPSYRISSKLKVAALIAAEHDLNGLNETELLNTTLYLRRDAITINEDVALFLTAQALLPTEEKARQQSSLEGGVGGIIKVDYKFSSFKKPSTVSYSLNTFKYIHDFDRNTSREANISYRFRNIVTYDVDLSKKFSFSFAGYFQSGFTYDNVAKEVFYLEQGVSYTFDQKFSVALLHNTTGNAFEKNGKDWNVEAYDSRNSTIAASLTYVY
jgi:hypothetical protein